VVPEVVAVAVPIEVPPLRTERTPVVNAALRWWWADPVAGLSNSLARPRPPGRGIRCVPKLRMIRTGFIPGEADW
jgi:hypothetical protein